MKEKGTHPIKTNKMLQMFSERPESGREGSQQCWLSFAEGMWDRELGVFLQHNKANFSGTVVPSPLPPT